MERERPDEGTETSDEAPAKPDGGQGTPAGGRPAASRRAFDGGAVLPDQTRDDTDGYWGERPASNDERLLADRPPHWG